MKNNNYVVIMAGGIGSRFWPVSRTSYPKQFIDILNTGETLLQATYNRYLSFIPNENIYIITAGRYKEIVQDQLPNLPDTNIIGEPNRKNTAPCIAYMAFKLKKQNPAANLIIAPSDHLIMDHDHFAGICTKALNFTATHQAFVTLGIQPATANTGYGYIQYESQSVEREIHKVLRFTEKPDRVTANRFLNDGNYLWNSGIFIWKAEDIIEGFRIHMPDLFDLFNRIISDLNTTRENSSVEGVYERCESISIDYAILEPATNTYVIPATFAWSDLGTWKSVWDNTAKDDTQNAVSGENALLIDTQGCIVHSTDKKLVLVGGVKDLIVVNTPDALMICNKEDEQEIKNYLSKVQQMRLKNLA